MPANPAIAIARSRRAIVSRRNGRLSHGARSVAGRAASSGNSLRHGLYSRQLILSTENPEEFAAIEAEFSTEAPPAVARDLAAATWRLLRIDRIESTLTVESMLSDRAVFRLHAALSREYSVQSNHFHKALHLRTKSEAIVENQPQFQRDSRNLGSFPPN